MSGIRIRALPYACTLAAFLLAVSVAGFGQLRDERAVRAAYVFNLTKYVEWPGGGSELVIGFEGNRPTGEILQKLLDGKTSDSRLIRVLLFPSKDELKRCNVLYVTETEGKKTQALLEGLDNRNMLTVGESAEFAKAGGMVSLVKAGDQIQIQVNVEAAQRAGIKISSRLLNLAVIVDERPVREN